MNTCAPLKGGKAFAKFLGRGRKEEDGARKKEKAGNGRRREEGIPPDTWPPYSPEKT